MERTCSTRRITSLLLTLVMLFSLFSGLCLEASAANTDYYQIVTNRTHLTSSDTRFTITGNRFTHKKVTIDGQLLYYKGPYYKDVAKWWGKHTKYYVWVYNKNSKLYKFYNGVKSGAKISLPIGKNDYTVVVRPDISSGWSEFETACHGYVDACWSYAQYRLKGV